MSIARPNRLRGPSSACKHRLPTPKHQLRIHPRSLPQSAIVRRERPPRLPAHLAQLIVRHQAVVAVRRTCIDDDPVWVLFALALPVAFVVCHHFLGRDWDVGVDGDVHDARGGEAGGLFREEGVAEEQRIRWIVWREVEVCGVIQVRQGLVAAKNIVRTACNHAWPRILPQTMSEFTDFAQQNCSLPANLQLALHTLGEMIDNVHTSNVHMYICSTNRMSATRKWGGYSLTMDAKTNAW